MRRRRVTLALVIVLLGGSILAAAPAGAHAVLVTADPAAEAELDTPPSEVELTFTEDISISGRAVRVFDPSGAEVPGVESEARGVTLTAQLPDLDADGSYTVGWRAVSADGHPISGAYLFHLREATLTEPLEIAQIDESLAAGVLRVLGSAMALIGVVAVLVAALGRTDGRWRSRWVPVLGGTVLVLAGATAAVGASVSDSLEVVLDTTSGRAQLVAIQLAAVGLIVSLWRLRRVELAVVSLTVLALALQGHAVSLSPVALGATFTVVHVVAAVAWATGLLWLDRRVQNGDGVAVLDDARRLSPWAIVAVAALAVSGAVLVLDRVPIGDIATSTYGRLAAVKVALLAVGVGIAVRNRSLVRATGVIEEADEPVQVPVGVGGSGVSGSGIGDPGSVGPAAESPGDGSDDLGDASAAVDTLARRVRLEVVVLAAALLVGATMGQFPPPGADAADGGGPYVERVAFGEGQVEVTLEPGRRGTNEVHVTAIDDDGVLMGEVYNLEVELSLPSEDLGPLAPEMLFVTDGHVITYPDIPLDGEWTLEVTGRVSDFEELRASMVVPVG